MITHAVVRMIRGLPDAVYLFSSEAAAWEYAEDNAGDGFDYYAVEVARCYCDECRGEA